QASGDQQCAVGAILVEWLITLIVSSDDKWQLQPDTRRVIQNSRSSTTRSTPPCEQLRRTCKVWTCLPHDSRCLAGLVEINLIKIQCPVSRITLTQHRWKVLKLSNHVDPTLSDFEIAEVNVARADLTVRILVFDFNPAVSAGRIQHPGTNLNEC